MKYSCFNDRLRLYEVFEDDRGHPMNGDLPVPMLGPDAGGIGVPATEAGRRLPGDAKRVGTSWHPRGLVVQCKPSPVRGLAGGAWAGLERLAPLALVGLAAAWLVYQLGEDR